MKIWVGNSKGIGRFVNKALCIPIVNPTAIPTNIPIRELENTRVYASKTYSLIIYDLVNPTALRTAISLDYSKILAVMEDTRLKKHKIITSTVITVKIIFVTSYYY